MSSVGRRVRCRGSSKLGSVSMKGVDDGNEVGGGRGRGKEVQSLEILGDDGGVLLGDGGGGSFSSGFDLGEEERSATGFARRRAFAPP